jgi:hypothetical protein
MIDRELTRENRTSYPKVTYRKECYSVEEATSVLYDIADEMGEAY